MDSKTVCVHAVQGGAKDSTRRAALRAAGAGWTLAAGLNAFEGYKGTQKKEVGLGRELDWICACRQAYG